MKIIILLLLSVSTIYSFAESTDTTLKLLSGAQQAEQTISLELGNHQLGHPQHLLANYKNINFNLNQGNDTIAQLSEIAIDAIRKGDEKKSIAFFYKALNLAIINKNAKQISFCYSNIGNFYIYKGMLNLGWKYTSIAFIVAKKINHTKAISNVNFNIGLIYYKQVQYNKAIVHFNQVLLARQILKDTFGTSLVLLNLSACYSDLSKNKLALKVSLQALELAESLNKLSLINSCYQNLEKIYYKLNNFDKAKEYTLKSIDLSESINNPKGLSNGYYLLAQFANDEGKYVEAAKYMNLSIDYLKQSGQIGEVILQCEKLANIYLEGENYKAAFEALSNYTAIKDSLENIEDKTSFENLQTNYEKLLSEKELKLKEKEVQVLNKDLLFKYYTIIGLVVLTGLLITILILYLKKKKSQIKQGEIQKVLISKENQILAKEKESLNIAIEHRNKELLSFALTTANKNEIIQSLKKELNVAIQDNDVKHNSAVRIKSLFKKFEHTEKDWKEFKMRFEEIENYFTKNLEKCHPTLSQSDIRICSLIRLKLSSKEISNILNITHESVNKSRYRLRKKLELDKEMSLNNFIATF